MGGAAVVAMTLCQTRRSMTDLRTLDADQLHGSLNWFRGIVVNKLRGLDVEAATRHRLPSGVTLLGIAKHLTLVEEEWFETVLDGVEKPAWGPDEGFGVAPEDTVESVIAAYEAQCERSRAIVAARAADQPSALPHFFFGIVTTEWVLFHMNRETAQHVGHMDVLRELTDGATGY